MAERPPVKGVDPQYRQALALEEISDKMDRLSDLFASIANSLLEVVMVLQSGKIVGIKVEPGPQSVRDTPQSQLSTPPPEGFQTGKKKAGPG